jgi:prevent-host-death family protein
MPRSSPLSERRSQDPRAQRRRTQWQLQEAKAKFSEVFDKALEDGPQLVTRRNKERVVIVSEKDYQKLKRSWKTPSLVKALLAMPKVRGFKIPERDKNDMAPSDRPVFD